MGKISDQRVVARGQAPAIRPISDVLPGVGDAVGPVEERLVPVLFEVIGIGIFFAARVKAHKRIVGEKERAAQVGAQGQGDPKVLVPVAKGAVVGPAGMPEGGWDGIGGRGNPEQVRDHGFVPAFEREVHGKLEIGRPMPVQDVLVLLPVPVPVHIAPQGGYLGAQELLLGVVAVEIGAHRQ